MCEPVMLLLDQLNKRFDTELVYVAVVVESGSVTVYGKVYPRFAVLLSPVFRDLIRGYTVNIGRWPAQKQIPDCTMVEYSSARFKLNVKAPYSIVFMFPGQVDPVLSLPVGL